MSEAHIAAYFILKQMGEPSFVQKLPDYGRIRNYVETSKDFKKRLKKVVDYQLAHENGMTGFDLLINVFNFDWHLSEYGEKTFLEKMRRGPGNKTFDIDQDYVTALLVNSQPKGRVIKPTYHFTNDFNTFLQNIASIRKRITGNYACLLLPETHNLSKLYDIDWMHTNAIVGVKDDDEVGMLLFRPPSFLDFPESRVTEDDWRSSSQEDIVKFLRDTGYTADYLKLDF